MQIYNILLKSVCSTSTLSGVCFFTISPYQKNNVSYVIYSECIDTVTTQSENFTRIISIVMRKEQRRTLVSSKKSLKTIVSTNSSPLDQSLSLYLICRRCITVIFWNQTLWSWQPQWLIILNLLKRSGFLNIFMKECNEAYYRNYCWQETQVISCC